MKLPIRMIRRRGKGKIRRLPPLHKFVKNLRTTIVTITTFIVTLKKNVGNCIQH
jgi:hypothetical protein